MGESGAEMAGYELWEMEQRHVAPFLAASIFGTAFRTTLLGIRNWRCSFWGGFLCLFLFLFSFFSRAVGEGHSWALGEESTTGEGSNSVRYQWLLDRYGGKGHSCFLLARYIGSALLQIVKF
jgi:hypothetical protein